jgi:signal peptidase I
MLGTLWVVAVGSVLVSLEISLFAALLWCGARWAEIGNVGPRRAFVISVVRYGVMYVLSVILRPVDTFGVMALLVGVMATWGVLVWLLRSTLYQAIKAWLPTLLGQGAMFACMLLLVKPFVIEAFSIPANSMAPTLLGRHCRGKCERCGGAAFCSPDVLDPSAFQVGTIRGMCEEELAACDVVELLPRVHGGDRILVSKLLSPKRWDLVVFRVPYQPEVRFVKRLVGLPGETVVIDQGAIWINGQRLTPPPPFEQLQFNSESEFSPFVHGHPDSPARLGPDEYFVLGDFQERSLDSRMWTQGAEGHPPYAVPVANLEGVVTHIYWPPHRVRAFK